MGAVRVNDHDDALFPTGLDWVPVVARVADHLTELAAANPALAPLAEDLRGLYVPPTCRWCGKRLHIHRHYYALNAYFCSRECMDEALADDHAERPAPA